MQGCFRFIEHTADVGIEISSPTLEGIYEIAGQALFHLVKPPGAAPGEKRTVESEGEEPELLLVNFLNDLLFLFEAEGLLFRTIKTQSLEEGRLKVEALCERMEPGATEVETVVKAATFHQVRVERKGPLWQAVVYLDL